MTKNSSKLESLFCGILFCISIAALVIACLAYTKKNRAVNIIKRIRRRWTAPAV